MAVYTPIKKQEQARVPYNKDYIKTENKPDEAETKPAEPASPKPPAAQ